MNRRKFIIGTAGAAIGGSVLVGSGAFTSVEADRGVEIDVVGDAEAFVSLDGDGEYVSEVDGDDTLFFNLGEETNSKGGEGFNERAVTDVPEIVTIENQGTQPINAGFGNTPSIKQDFEFPGEGDDRNDILVTLEVDVDEDNPDTVDPGNSTSISVTVDSRDGAVEDPVDAEQTEQTVELNVFEPDQFPDFPENGETGPGQ